MHIKISCTVRLTAYVEILDLHEKLYRDQRSSLVFLAASNDLKSCKTWIMKTFFYNWKIVCGEKRRHDTQDNDIQQNGTRHNRLTHHNAKAW